MKHFLLATLFISSSLYGQFVQDIPKQDIQETKNKEKSTYANWYNYGDAIDALGGNVAYYRSTLFPDSTVQVEFSSGMGYVWQHSIGQVLDPTSIFFEINNLESFNEHNRYTLDSVGIYYRYWRHQQAN